MNNKIFSTVIYGVIILFTLFSYFFIDANYIYLKHFFTGISFDHRIFVSIVYFLCIIILFTFYCLFIYFGKSEKILKNITNKKILLGGVILIYSYPAMLSYDIFNYIATAKVTFFYNENPYIIMPNEFIGDPILLFTHASNKIALYGPMWIFLTGIPFIFSIFGYVVTTVAFKSFAGAFYFLTLFVLSKMIKDRYGILLFALNPLILVETFISGHNDIVMMFFAILSFYLLEKKHFVLAFLALICSILIKYATIILLPLFMYVIILNLIKKSINLRRIFVFAFILMSAIFFLSSIREEIYPWYATWFLVFLPLLYRYKNVLIYSVAISLFLMMRYIPFMLFGTHFGFVPIIKILILFIPIISISALIFLKKITN